MQVEIFVNGNRLDTDTSTRIAETKQVNDFFEAADRQTSYTNTFTLPMTPRNIMILGGYGIPGNTSLAPYRIHNVSVYRDGIQTISEGIGYTKPNNNGRFQMYAYSENISLFDALGDKAISDLNLISLSHSLNTQSWINSFNRSDYTYAIADYGKLDSNTVEIDYQAPALYVKYLWNKIFAESGFKWKYSGRGGRNDFNPFITPEWSEVAITIDEGLPAREESINPVQKLQISKDKSNEFKGQTINFLGQEIIVQELTGEVVEYIRFETDLDPDGMHVITETKQYRRSRIRIQQNGFYKLSISGDFYNTKTENAAMYIEKDGHNLFTVNDDFDEEQSSVGFEERLYLQAGEELFVKVVTLPTDNESTYGYGITLSMDLDNTVAAVNFSSYLTKIKQVDFIKDVVQYYGLVYRRKGDTYEFMAIEELLDPTAEYLNPVQSRDIYDDWSRKFNRIIGNDSKVGNYAKNNLFRYRYDNSEETFADSSVKIDDQTLVNEKTLIERLYRAPDRSTSSLSGEPLRACSLYQKEYDDDGSLKSVKPVKAEPYFFRVVKKNIAINYRPAGTSGSSSYNGSVPFMSFDNLDFNNVLPNRYSSFGNMVNYGVKYTAELFLSVLDIHTLDFFKLKYIKQLGGLFYLNKVSNYTGGLVNVELIRVRSIEKLGEFSDDFSDDFNT